MADLNARAGVRGTCFGLSKPGNERVTATTTPRALPLPMRLHGNPDVIELWLPPRR